MGKRKFKISHSVTPNSKAPLYLKARAKRGETFEIIAFHGDGKYGIENENGESFGVQGSFLDLVENAQGTQSVIDHLSDSKSEDSALPKTSKTVGEFIEDQESKIKSVESGIQKEIDEIKDRKIICHLALGLNKIPSPQVYKLMHQLIDLNPALGEKTMVELYEKAESVLEETLDLS